MNRSYKGFAGLAFEGSALEGSAFEGLVFIKRADVEFFQNDYDALKCSICICSEKTSVILIQQFS